MACQEVSELINIKSYKQNFLVKEKELELLFI